jgi:phage gp29-like protein
LALSVGSTWSGLRDAWRLGSSPRQDRIYTPAPNLDFVEFLTDGLTFSRLRSEINAALCGEIGRGIKLFAEMESKDLRWRSVANTRRQALTNLDWEVVSAADLMEHIEDRTLADEAAAFVTEQFSCLDGFAEALEHLATGIGSNLSLVELVWEGLKLIEISPVDGARLRVDPMRPGTLLLATADNPRGVELPPAKFIIHMPHGASVCPLERSLSKPQAMISLAKLMSFNDWKVFCELFGMPVRIAHYESSMTSEDRASLIDMMKNLGARAWGVFSRAVTVEIKESSQRGVAPFEAFVAHCDRETSILWLGGHLTTDTTGGTGTLAAAQVHDEVRDDVRDDDIKRESRTVRRDLIAPMCVFRFPGRDVPLPYFRRIKPEAIDRLAEATVIAAAQRAGLRVGRTWAHERLSIPEPDADDDPLDPVFDAFGDGLQERVGEGT